MNNKEILTKTIEKLINRKGGTINTGFEDLDLMLSGIEKGSLITIGGRPSMGKTALLMSIFENILKQDYKCLYLSFGTIKEQFFKRFLIQYCELNSVVVNEGLLSDKDTIKLQKSISDIEDFDFLVSDNSQTIDSIEEQIKDHKPDYVFIDSLQLVKVNEKKQRTEEISKAITRLKEIARENEVFIFITSQLSRDVENRCDKRPMLCDLKESGTIEEVSDVIIFIYREEYYNTQDIDNKGKAEIIIAKNKFGPIGFITLGFRSSIPKYYQRIRSNKF